MRSKLNYLINVSLKRKIKTKWFLISNIVLMVLIIGVINIDSIITAFGGDFNDKTKIYVVDNTNKTYDSFSANLKYYSKSLSKDKDLFEIKKYDKSIESAKKIIKTKEKESVLLVFSDNSENVIKVQAISLTTIDTYNFQIISEAVNTTKSMLALKELGLSNEEYSKISSSVDIKREIIDSDATTEDENMQMIMTTVFPIIILPFFMLSLYLVQMIGAEVNDEKSTKSMEIIISNVSPKTHFFAKIIAGNLFVIIQGLLLLVYGSIGLFIRKQLGGNNIADGVGAEVMNAINMIKNVVNVEQLTIIIPFTILLMLITFLAYSLVAGILASMTTNTEDYQQIQVPIVIISVVGYYLSMMAGMFKGALFIKILSFVPFISAILSPSLLVLGQIGIFEVIISILIMFIFVYLLIRYGLRIYKVGILNYSQSGIWKKIFRALKSK